MPLRTLPPDQHFVRHRHKCLLLDISSSGFLAVLKRITVTQPVSRARVIAFLSFSLLLDIFSSFKVGTACISYLCWSFGCSVSYVSSGPRLCCCWVSKKALEPGTWSGPLGKASAVDLGCIPILTPIWYWKEYGVTRALPGTWMIEHLACVLVLRPGKYTCENRVCTPVSIPTINPLMHLPKAY